MLTQIGSFRALKVDNRSKARLGKMQMHFGQLNGMQSGNGLRTSIGGKEVAEFLVVYALSRD